MHIAAGAFDLWQAIDGVAQLRAQQVDVDARFGQQATHAAALLVEQRNHDVCRLDELVILANGQRLRIAQAPSEICWSVCRFALQSLVPDSPAPELTLK